MTITDLATPRRTFSDADLLLDVRGLTVEYGTGPHALDRKSVV